MNREERARYQWVLQATPRFLVLSTQTASYHRRGSKNLEGTLIFLENLSTPTLIIGDRGSTTFKVLCYKSEVR